MDMLFALYFNVLAVTLLLNAFFLFFCRIECCQSIYNYNDAVMQSNDDQNFKYSYTNQHILTLERKWPSVARQLDSSTPERDSFSCTIYATAELEMETKYDLTKYFLLGRSYKLWPEIYILNCQNGPTKMLIFFLNWLFSGINILSSICKSLLTQ